MKRCVTVLGICALALTVGAANAATTNWQGDDGSNPSHFSVAANWDNGVPGCSDLAVVASKTTEWPQLDDGDEGVNHFTMQNAADLDANGNTLFVDGTFTAEDTADVDSTASAVTITNSSSGGGITAEQIVFNGGTYGMTIAVSGTTTVRTCSAVTCGDSLSATCP